MSEWGRERNRELWKRYRSFRKSQMDPILWPWGDFNDQFGKIVPGWVYTIGARPKNGKTTFLMNLYSYLQKQEAPVLAFGTELDPSAMVMKWACIELGIPELKAFQNELSEQEEESLDKKIVELLRSGLVTFSDAAHLTLPKIADEIESAAAAGDLPHVVVIDHIHMMSQSKEELDFLAKEFQEMAKGLRIVVLLAAQLNRGQSELDLYLPPRMDRLKGSAALEECTTAGFGLYRPLRKGVTVADIRRIKHEDVDPSTYSYSDTMAVVCMAHRYHGKAMNRTVKLKLNGNRLRSFVPESFQSEEDEDDEL